ncbi:hypothetical protein SNK03_005350 [Fusarium graminearum]
MAPVCRDRHYMTVALAVGNHSQRKGNPVDGRESQRETENGLSVGFNCCIPVLSFACLVVSLRERPIICPVLVLSLIPSSQLQCTKKQSEIPIYNANHLPIEPLFALSYP